jgi:hypothetical protein
VASGFWIAYGHANNWDFPSPEFYPVSAEVIVLLLLGLIIERRVIAELHWLHRVEYGVILMAGEGAHSSRSLKALPAANPTRWSAVARRGEAAA